jgi:hypothetical protein
VFTYEDDIRKPTKNYEKIRKEGQGKERAIKGVSLIKVQYIHK